MKYNWNKFKTIEDKKIKYSDIIDQCIVKYIIYPILPIVVNFNLSANFITTLSLICGITSVLAIQLDNYFLGSFLFLLRYILDCLDGCVARLTDTTSSFGDIYDHCVDYFTFILFYISCFTLNFSPIFMIILHILLFCSILHYTLIYRKIKKGIIYRITYWIQINEKLEKLFKFTKHTGTGLFTIFCTIGILLHS